MGTTPTRKPPAKAAVKTEAPRTPERNPLELSVVNTAARMLVTDKAEPAAVITYLESMADHLALVERWLAAQAPPVEQPAEKKSTELVLVK